MKRIRRIMSFLLALVLVFGMVPPGVVRAEETVTESTFHKTDAAETTEVETENAEETNVSAVETEGETKVAESVRQTISMESTEESVISSIETSPEEEIVIATEETAGYSTYSSIKYEKEPNGSTANATGIGIEAYDSTTIRGELSGRDVDYFMFDVPLLLHTVTIKVQAVYKDYMLTLYDSNGKSAGFAGSPTKNGSGDYELTLTCALQPGVYYIYLRENAVTPVNNPYEFTVKMEEYSAPCTHVNARETVTKPTCVDSGYTTYSCIDCGAKWTIDYTDPTGVHTYTDSQDTTCNVCGATRKLAISWTLVDGTLTISGEGKMDYTTSPWKNSSSIKNVVIERGITDIGKQAFYGCSNLTSVTIPDTVDIIGEQAFYNCEALTQVMLTNVSEIGKQAFDSCDALRSIIIPGSVYTIKADAFALSGLRNIFFVGSAPSIASDAFFLVTANAYYRTDRSGWTDSRKADYGGRLTWIAAQPSNCPHPYQVTVKAVAPTCTEKGLTEGTRCIMCQKMMVAQKEVAALGHKVVNGTCTRCGTCPHTQQTPIPAVTPTCLASGLTEGSRCTNCDEILVAQETVPALGHNVVNGTCTRCGENKDALASGTCGENLVWVLEKDGTMTISGSGNMAYWNNHYAMPWNKYKPKITKLVITAGVTDIGNYAFYGCSALTSVKIPDGITSIGSSAFSGCSLTSITIPESVTKIGSSAFASCKALNSLAIPASVSTLGSGFVNGCSSLEEILVDAGNPHFTTVDGVVFSGDRKELVCYPAGKKTTSYSIPAEVASIGTNAFSGCSALTSITIPESVTSIGHYAFSYCSTLTSITIPESITSIGEYAFSGCSALTSITIPKSVAKIGRYTFNRCTALSSITISEGVTAVNGTAFNQCKSLKTLTLPASITQITAGYENIFASGCTALEEILVAPGNTEFISIDGVLISKSGTLYGYPRGKTAAAYTVPNGVKTIVYSTFSGCAALTDITLPESISRIEGYAFDDTLDTITFLGDPPVFDSDAFYHVTAEARYPAYNEKWTDSVKKNYYGTLTWVPHWEGCPHQNQIALEAVVPTCTETGLTEGWQCTLCQAIVVPQEIVPLLDHTEMVDAAVAPTCTETGLTEGKHCSVCNEVLVAQEVVAVLGHTEVIDAAVAPTCAETGLKEGKHCSVCNEVLLEQEIIPAIGHNFEMQNEQVLCVTCEEELSLNIPQEHIILTIGKSVTLEVSPADFAEKIQWIVEGDDGTVTFKDNEVIAKAAGTVFVKAVIAADEFQRTVRFRVDVAEDTCIDGIQPSVAELTTELYSTDYTSFEILLKLPQNYSASSTTDVQRPQNQGVAIESARFTDSDLAELFELVVLDDRRVLVVPTQDAIDAALANSKAVKSSYSSTLSVTIAGMEEPIETEETLTLKVKQTKPKLKASVAPFNSFYGHQSNEITISGATVTGIALDDSKSNPNWIALEDGALALTEDAPAKNVSAKVYLLVDTEEWAIPVLVTLSIKNSYKAPTVKLSATSITLNKAVETGAEILVTSSDANYAIVNPSIRITGQKVTGELLVSYEDGVLHIETTEKTPAKATYKVYLGAPGCKEVSVTVKVISGIPTVTFKAAGNLDLSLRQPVTITPAFKNYNGSFVIEETIAQTAKKQVVSELFRAEQSGRSILVSCAENTPLGSYTLTLKLKLDNGDFVENTVKVNVKRTAVKLKLSATKVTLNKNLKHSAVIDVTSATKGYDLGANMVKVTAPAEVKAEYAEGKLTVSLTDAATYGKTYKVTVQAYEGAPAVTLSVAVPAANKSNISAALKAAGTIDVIREGTAITVTPSFTNAFASDFESLDLTFYRKDGKNWTQLKENIPFYVVSENGKFLITAAEGLNHSDKYRVELVAQTKVTGETVKSKQMDLKVKMGSAKVSVQSSDTMLFAKDKNDRALVWFESADVTLNQVEGITIKDAKYQNVFEIIDYENGQFAIGFKDGMIHKDIAKQLEKKASVNITLNLNVFVSGNESAKANTTAKVTLTIVK